MMVLLNTNQKVKQSTSDTGSIRRRYIGLIKVLFRSRPDTFRIKK